MFPVSSEQAQQVISRAMRQQRSQRTLPTLAKNIAQFSDQTRVFIHNVGPWEHKVSLGSWGMYTVPACPKDKPFATGNPIPGVYTEPIPVDEKKYQLETIDGTYFADQVIGRGKNMSASTSLVRLGVFSSSNEIPAAEELAAARGELMGEFKRLVDEAEIAYAQGPKKFEEMVGDGVKHKMAAVALGRSDLKWMQQATVGAMVACIACGTFIGPQVILCPQCGVVQDEERYEREIKSRMTKARRG